MPRPTLREKIYTIIHGTDTAAGRGFDIILLWLILASIFVVCIESIPSLHSSYYQYFILIEWFFTICFTLEYFLRIYSHHRPVKYITSFYGLIDILSILPTFLTFFLPGLHYLMTIRILRLLRIFRILKLTQFIQNAQVLKQALIASVYKITVFILAVFSLVLIVGSVIYVVEGEENGFTSIPQSIYWAIVTITTVGYGDITPQTPLGQIISSIVMMMGYAIIAVPTGIVTVELTKSSRTRKAVEQQTTQVCPHCQHNIAAPANYCSNCGQRLVELA